MIQIGIAGYTGRMGWWHFQVLKRAARQLRINSEFHLFAPHPKETGDASHLYSNVDHFLENRSFDLLVVAVHPQHRLDLYRGLVRRRSKIKCIFLEKPLSFQGAGNRTLLRLEKRFAPVTIVNYPELFDPLTAEVLAILTGKRDSIPELKIREIQCYRSKDRENGTLAENGRHTEPLVIQEGVHDLAFVLHVLRECSTKKNNFSLISSVSTDLRHPSGSMIPGAGSSYSLFQETKSKLSLAVINSFIDPYVRKEKVFVCTGKNGNNYAVVANHQPFDRRSLKVYDYRGAVVFDGARDRSVRKALERQKQQWNLEFMKQLVVMVKNRRVASNFDLAVSAEQYCQGALRHQLKYQHNR